MSAEQFERQNHVLAYAAKSNAFAGRGPKALYRKLGNQFEEQVS
jgi:hypothetical protein